MVKWFAHWYIVIGEAINIYLEVKFSFRKEENLALLVGIFRMNLTEQISMQALSLL